MPRAHPVVTYLKPPPPGAMLADAVFLETRAGAARLCTGSVGLALIGLGGVALMQAAYATECAPCEGGLALSPAVVDRPSEIRSDSLPSRAYATACAMDIFCPSSNKI